MTINIMDFFKVLYYEKNLIFTHLFYAFIINNYTLCYSAQSTR